MIADLKPTFVAVAQQSSALLMKCLHGKTQNQNESFNKMIWDRVPKNTYVGRGLFELGLYDDDRSFNMDMHRDLLRDSKENENGLGKHATAGCKKN